MAGRDRAELAEALDLLDRHRLVAEQMQQRVEQHRAVAGREHEAVAVGPGRIGRIELQEPREQHGRDVGRAHRQAGMAGFRLLDRVHGERADGVGHAVVLGARRAARALAARRRDARMARRRRGKTSGVHGGAKRLCWRGSSMRARGVKECRPRCALAMHRQRGTSSGRTLTASCRRNVRFSL